MWRKFCDLVAWRIVRLFWVVELKKYILYLWLCVVELSEIITHILLCGGSPRADFFGMMTTGDAHGEMLLVMMSALSNVLISFRTHS